MNPAKLQRMLTEGLAHHQAGRLAEAEKHYSEARAAAPKHFDALHLSGVLAFQQGRFAAAAELLARALKADPRSAICEMRLGLALAALGRPEEAEKCYRGSLKKDPKIPETWNNLAVVLKALGRIDEAAAAYSRAIELRPDYYDAYDRLGALIGDTKGLPFGIPYFRKAVELKQDYAEGWCNLGLALTAEFKTAEALECFDKSLAANPNLAQAHVGRGLVLQESYRLTEALAALDRAIAIEPRHFQAHSARLLTLNYLSGMSRETAFEEHKKFGQLFDNVATGVRLQPRPKAPGQKLRVAFLSPDLRRHSIAYFIEPILRHLDRDTFEIVLYHDHFQVDAMSERLRALGTLWRNFVGQADVVVEKTIRGDAIDILVDLAGHTGLNRLPVLARRVAPVQISYLGYPNTTGLRTMDYRFVDAITDPTDEDQRYHTEKLVQFAPTAWAYSPPANAPEPIVRVEGGCPHSPSTITFGSFNNFAKVSDATLDLWRRVLEAVPGSRLVLKAHSLDRSALAPLLDTKLERLGVARERVELLGRTADLQAHLALYNRMDVALDTFPYHGTTTTCEALWMGVPVVTLHGDRHAARVSSSLLTAIGHPEWIAHSKDEYVRIASEFAHAPAELTRLRTTLRDDLRRSSLLDHARQTARFAQGLLTCWNSPH